ncbi:transmembrane protein 145 [Trichonephila inaurata madagascariensis]|uniref:Transmembrane protein 145 n=1 Tax=Trichonephila inaurata madagascariensis TaxID=2747483 RepID=A0A8X6MEB7_9ARAC|nr:transmembrane protein 145 [Trichonephila inaurata madagascariensis]
MNSWKSFLADITVQNVWKKTYTYGMKTNFTKRLEISGIEVSSSNFTSSFEDTIDAALRKSFPCDPNSHDNSQHRVLRSEAELVYESDDDVPFSRTEIDKVLEALSTLLLLMMLIFIAKGYTVTRGRLRKKTLLKIAAFLWLYVIVYVILFLYERKFFDPGKVLYIYESPAGYGIIGLRLVGWAWFVYAVIFTMMHYPEKSNFYTKLFLLYSLWFLSAPVVILISTFIVPKWVREKLLNSVELFISIGAHFVFFILTRPSKANKNFPYHVRTSQIGVMLQTDGSTPTGDNSIDKFAHHPYALTASNTTPNYVAIFGIQANGNDAPSTERVTSGDFPMQKPTAPPIEEAVIRRS